MSLTTTILLCGGGIALGYLIGWLHGFVVAIQDGLAPGHDDDIPPDLPPLDKNLRL